MVRVHLSNGDLANIRFAFSPLWESVAAFRVLRAGQSPGIHAPWARTVRHALKRTDWSVLDDLLFTQTGYLPDFIAPPPRHPLSRIEDELAQLATTPAAVVKAELGKAYRGALPSTLMRTPESLLAEVTRLLTLFWRRAISPYWPRVREVLDAEVAYRSRALALGGADALFKGLHPMVRFQTLVLDIRSGSRMLKKVRARRGLLLVPSVFSWPDVFVVTSAPWRTTLAYPARGLAELWQAPRPESRHALGAVVGRTTGRILVALHTPRTTLSLAHTLELTPGAVSQHVCRLHRIGLLERDRVGVRVYYVLATRGRDLLEVLDAPRARANRRS